MTKMPVLLVDMDYFFAACEEQRHPELKGKPLIVGSASANDRTRGVVQTCNYEARAFGIHSGMPLSDAFKLYPKSSYIEADDDYYEKISSQIMSMLKGYGFKIEIMSIDEAALDIDDKTYEEAESIGNDIKKNILAHFGLKCTVGISTTKVYAKMACDAAKPDGLLVVREADVLDFIKEKSVGKLPGIGRKTALKLSSIGISTIGELAKADPSRLIDMFGSLGIEMFLMANGKDSSKVIEESEVLSIGRERTLPVNTSSIAYIDKALLEISDEVWKEVEKQDYWFRGVSVKVRYDDFTEHIKNTNITNYESSKSAIYKNATKLVRDLLTGNKKVRKLGIRVYGLVPRKGQMRLA